MESILLVYTGRREGRDGKLLYKYLDSNNVNESLCFSKPIYPATIGTIIEAQRRENGVGSPYKTLDSRASDSDITKWSIEERVVLERIAGYKAAKVKSNAHIDELIKSVRDNTMSYADRKTIARYITEQILK